MWYSVVLQPVFIHPRKQTGRVDACDMIFRAALVYRVASSATC